MPRSLSKVILAGAAAMFALVADDNALSRTSGSVIAQAEARMGRPLTPMSAAGVARRQHRRAVYGAAAVGAAAAGAAAVAPRCYMTTNGQVCN